MFVSSRSIASVEAAVAAMLDLASHARFLRTSRAVGRMCRLRAASPQVVALWRVVPQHTVVVDDEQEATSRASAIRPGKPRTVALPPPPAIDAYQTRIWTALGRVYYGGDCGHGDGYRRVRDLSLDDGRHEYIRGPPSLESKGKDDESDSDADDDGDDNDAEPVPKIMGHDLPVRHAVWHMAPRVLDLCHLQLPTDTVRRLVASTAPTLQHFCVDATRVTDIVDLLAAPEAPRLRELCLYGVPNALRLAEVLERLPHLERLVAPSTNAFLGALDVYVARSDSVRPSRLVRLALIAPRYYLSRRLATARIDWAGIAAAVPLLREFVFTNARLESHVVHQLLAACPNLDEIRCGGIFATRDPEYTDVPTPATTMPTTSLWSTAFPPPTLLSSSSSSSSSSSVPASTSLPVPSSAPRHIVCLGDLESIATLTAIDPDPDALEQLGCDFRRDDIEREGANFDEDEDDDDDDEKDIVPHRKGSNNGFAGAERDREIAEVLTRFTKLRFLSVSVYNNIGIGGTCLRLIGEGLPLLELLWLSGMRFDGATSARAGESSSSTSNVTTRQPLPEMTESDGASATAAAVTSAAAAATTTTTVAPAVADVAAISESERYFLPLRRLSRLRDMQLAWGREASRSVAVELPALPALAAFSARYTHFSTAHVAARCPNLVYLTPPRDIASDASLEAVARMPQLQILCVEQMRGSDSEVPFWHHHANSPGLFSPQHLERFLRMRRDNGITGKLAVRVPWPHDHGRETEASGSVKTLRAPTAGAPDDSGVRLILCGGKSTAELAVISRRNTEVDGGAAIVLLALAAVVVAAVLGIAWNFDRRPWQ